jgi:flagellar hook-associated protein 1 FlgK
MAMFDVLGIGRSGLLAQQRALQTTGSNVANVNTPGYARQRTNLESVPLAVGGGVWVAGTEQIVDAFLEERWLGQRSALSSAGARRDLLDAVQRSFPVGDASIAEALQGFFAAANELANHPEDLTVRAELLDRAELLASRIRGAAAGVASVQREADGRLVEQVGEVNERLAQIAQLNQAVARAEASGDGASELRDQRRGLLGELADGIGVRTVERADGTVDVFAPSGVTLVLGGEAARLEARLGTTLGLDGAALHDVGVVAPDDSLIPLGADPGGTIGGLLGVRDGELVSDAADLDQLATALRDAVNAVQTDVAGRDLDGLVGSPLFAGAGAADLVVALSDPRGIAAAQSTNTADNANALALVDVQSASLPALGGASLGGFFGRLHAAVGMAARDASAQVTVEESLSDALAAQRDAVSGVNLEEEFVDLVRFQRAFQASAELIALGDRLLEDVLAMVRR